MDNFVSIFGISISKMNMAETVEYLADVIARRDVHQVITANPIMLMAAQDDPQFHRIMREADLLVPDGTGVVWAAKRYGEPVQERVAGYDLLHALLKAGEKHRWRVYLLGSSSEVIQETYSRLSKMYPAVHIVGYRDGFFTAAEDAEVVRDIREKAPDLLFVAREALTTQEPWIRAYKHELGVPVMMGVGGSFDAITGKNKRAPQLFIRLRLEWFYRLLKQPTRAKRMLALPKFVIAVLRAKRGS